MHARMQRVEMAIAGMHAHNLVRTRVQTCICGGWQLVEMAVAEPIGRLRTKPGQVGHYFWKRLSPQHPQVEDRRHSLRSGRVGPSLPVGWHRVGPGHRCQVVAVASWGRTLVFAMVASAKPIKPFILARPIR